MLTSMRTLWLLYLKLCCRALQTKLARKILPSAPASRLQNQMLRLRRDTDCAIDIRRLLTAHNTLKMSATSIDKCIDNRQFWILFNEYPINITYGVYEFHCTYVCLTWRSYSAEYFNIHVYPSLFWTLVPCR